MFEMRYSGATTNTSGTPNSKVNHKAIASGLTIIDKSSPRPSEDLSTTGSDVLLTSAMGNNSNNNTGEQKRLFTIDGKFELSMSTRSFQILSSLFVKTLNH